jgi:hypothetical protein
MRAESMDELRNKLKALQARFSMLDKSISDEKAKEYFLKLTSYLLGDAEGYLAKNQLELAGCILALIDAQLSNAEKVVITYGSGVTIKSKS